MAPAPLDFGDGTVTVAREGPALLRSRKIRVEVVAGPDAGLVTELAGPEARLGSGRQCDLVLHDPTVSRQHVVLRVEGQWVRVIDETSHNGTLVDGLRVFDACARPDSTIAIGNTTLRLLLLPDVIDLPLSSRERFGAMLGRSSVMRRLFAVLERVAPTEETILVEGETGTGKELVAEALHEESRRASGPFVVFDCSAVTPSLIESELFGHVRGAFTGAVADRTGAFVAADRGTLFLDEIGELPLDLQPKLLRAVERLEVRPVGAASSTRVDVRVVAATHRSLAAEVDRQRFREDLFYRLAVVHVRVPPLRERGDDVTLLAQHFATQVSHRSGTASSLSEGLIASLQGRAWPGNVRELRNAVARALSLGIGPAAEAAPTSPTPAIDRSIPLKVGRERIADAYEREYLRQTLDDAGGNLTRAAELAGVSRKFVQRAVKLYGLRGDDLDEE